MPHARNLQVGVEMKWILSTLRQKHILLRMCALDLTVHECVLHLASCRIDLYGQLSCDCFMLMVCVCVGCSHRKAWRWAERSTEVYLDGSRSTWRKLKDFSKCLKSTWRRERKPPEGLFCLRLSCPGRGRTMGAMTGLRRWSISDRDVCQLLLPVCFLCILLVWENVADVC